MMNNNESDAAKLEQSRIDSIRAEFPHDRGLIRDAIIYGWSVERTQAEDAARGHGTERQSSIIEGKLNRAVECEVAV